MEVGGMKLIFESQFCNVCGEWMPLDHHTCPPIWYVRLSGDLLNDNPKKVYAENARKAAERFCMQHDARGDYDIIHGGGTEVIVLDEDRQSANVYRVDARSEPTYSAMLKRS
jgi:hypothetical protein